MHNYQEVLLDEVYKVLPRVLSHQDRNVISPTYGSFDRHYWGWRMKDIPDMSLQYAVYPLTLIWSLDREDNEYFRCDIVKEAIIAGMTNWLNHLHNDGSCDQCMPYERSVGVTAYVLMAMMSAFEEMRHYLSSEDEKCFLHAMSKSARYISRNDEVYGVISNHLALFAAVMAKAAVLLGEEGYRARAREFIDTIREHRSEEGWFAEYGGADPGYQTQCMYYLMEYYRLTNDVDAREMAAEAAVNFMIYFAHPDGSFGGDYGSRNNEIFYPAGFAMLGGIDEAFSLLFKMVQSISDSKTPTPKALDIANAVRLITNYLMAASCVPTNNVKQLPCEQDGVEKYFPEAGIYVSGTRSHYSIVGAKKGGVLKVYDKRSKRLVFDDCGWWVTNSRGSVYTTNVLQRADVKVSENRIEVRTHFYKSLQERVTIAKYLLLRILSVVVGGVTVKGHDCLKKMLVRLLISKRSKCQLELRRCVEFDDDKLRVNDEVRYLKKITLRNAMHGAGFSGVSMASSNYYTKGLTLPKCNKAALDIDKVNSLGNLKVQTLVGIDGNLQQEVLYHD